MGGDTAHDATPDGSRTSRVRPVAAVRIASTEPWQETEAEPDGVDADGVGPDGVDAGGVGSDAVSGTGNEGAHAVVQSGDARHVAGPHGSRARAVAVLVVVSFLAVVADIVTKQLVITHLREGEPVRVIGGVLYFDLIRNGGAAFSMGTGVTWVFPAIAIVVVSAIAYLSLRLRSIGWAIALGLVVGGALGNLIDRLFRAPAPFRGEVVDFISLFSNSGRGFAIFNFADSCLTIGVILAVLLELTGRHRDGSRART
ncbi:MAG TPA: signal peptidase II [Micromonosporaceae bacterium]